MVPIIENWTRVRGVMERNRPSEQPAGPIAVDLRLDGVEAVNGYPNLLRAAAGDVITVLVRAAPGGAHDWRPGTVLEGRVRRAGVHRIFAHPEEFGPPRPEG